MALAIEVINRLVRYDSDKGALFWKERENFRESGNEVGRRSTQKYKRVSIGGKCLMLHRVVYFIHHGVWPETIDHIDGDGHNNRIENLRAATYQENNRNRTSTPTSGQKGVYKQANGTYTVNLKMDGKSKHYGSGMTLEEATMKAQKIITEAHGVFAHATAVENV